MNIEHLVCHDCGRQFGLASGTGKLMAESLPDVFEGTCPHCGNKAEYTKDSIRRETFGKTRRGNSAN